MSNSWLWYLWQFVLLFNPPIWTPLVPNMVLILVCSAVACLVGNYKRPSPSALTWNVVCSDLNVVWESSPPTCLHCCWRFLLLLQAVKTRANPITSSTLNGAYLGNLLVITSKGMASGKALTLPLISFIGSSLPSSSSSRRLKCSSTLWDLGTSALLRPVNESTQPDRNLWTGPRTICYV